MSIDVEALVANFLRGQTAVTDIVEDRVYTDLPHKREYPVVLVNRTGGGSLYKNWLEAAEVEISAYGGTHKLAYLLASACMSAMTGAMVGTHPEGVVTKVSASATAYEPEPDALDPQGHARPRYVVSAVVTAHP
jgi:Protein of unknown function (DUF3168)